MVNPINYNHNRFPNPIIENPHPLPTPNEPIPLINVPTSLPTPDPYAKLKKTLYSAGFDYDDLLKNKNNIKYIPDLNLYFILARTDILDSIILNKKTLQDPAIEILSLIYKEYFSRLLSYKNLFPANHVKTNLTKSYLYIIFNIKPVKFGYYTSYYPILVELFRNTYDFEIDPANRVDTFISRLICQFPRLLTSKTYFMSIAEFFKNPSSDLKSLSSHFSHDFEKFWEDPNMGFECLIFFAKHNLKFLFNVFYNLDQIHTVHQLLTILPHIINHKLIANQALQNSIHKFFPDVVIKEHEILFSDFTSETCLLLNMLKTRRLIYTKYNDVDSHPVFFETTQITGQIATDPSLPPPIRYKRTHDDISICEETFFESRAKKSKQSEVTSQHPQISDFIKKMSTVTELYLEQLEQIHSSDIVNLINNDQLKLLHFSTYLQIIEPRNIYMNNFDKLTISFSINQLPVDSGCLTLMKNTRNLTIKLNGKHFYSSEQLQRLFQEIPHVKNLIISENIDLKSYEFLDNLTSLEHILVLSDGIGNMLFNREYWIALKRLLTNNPLGIFSVKYHSTCWDLLLTNDEVELDAICYTYNRYLSQHFQSIFAFSQIPLTPQILQTSLKYPFVALEILKHPQLNSLLVDHTDFFSACELALIRLPIEKVYSFYKQDELVSSLENLTSTPSNTDLGLNVIQILWWYIHDINIKTQIFLNISESISDDEIDKYLTELLNTTISSIQSITSQLTVFDELIKTISQSDRIKKLSPKSLTILFMKSGLPKLHSTSIPFYYELFRDSLALEHFTKNFIVDEGHIYNDYVNLLALFAGNPTLIQSYKALAIKLSSISFNSEGSIEITAQRLTVSVYSNSNIILDLEEECYRYFDSLLQILTDPLIIWHSACIILGCNKVSQLTWNKAFSIFLQHIEINYNKAYNLLTCLLENFPIQTAQFLANLTTSISFIKLEGFNVNNTPFISSILNKIKNNEQQNEYWLAIFNLMLFWKLPLDNIEPHYAFFSYLLDSSKDSPVKLFAAKLVNVALQQSTITDSEIEQCIDIATINPWLLDDPSWTKHMLLPAYGLSRLLDLIQTKYFFAFDKIWEDINKHFNIWVKHTYENENYHHEIFTKIIKIIEKNFIDNSHFQKSSLFYHTILRFLANNLSLFPKYKNAFKWVLKKTAFILNPGFEKEYMSVLNVYKSKQYKDDLWDIFNAIVQQRNNTINPSTFTPNLLIKEFKKQIIKHNKMLGLVVLTLSQLDVFNIVNVSDEDRIDLFVAAEVKKVLPEFFLINITNSKFYNSFISRLKLHIDQFDDSHSFRASINCVQLFANSLKYTLSETSQKFAAKILGKHTTLENIELSFIDFEANPVFTQDLLKYLLKIARKKSVISNHKIYIWLSLIFNGKIQEQNQLLVKEILTISPPSVYQLKKLFSFKVPQNLKLINALEENLQKKALSNCYSIQLNKLKQRALAEPVLKIQLAPEAESLDIDTYKILFELVDLKDRSLKLLLTTYLNKLLHNVKNNISNESTPDDTDKRLAYYEAINKRLKGALFYINKDLEKLHIKDYKAYVNDHGFYFIGLAEAGKACSFPYISSTTALYRHFAEPYDPSVKSISFDINIENAILHHVRNLAWVAARKVMSSDKACSNHHYQNAYTIFFNNILGPEPVTFERDIEDTEIEAILPQIEENSSNLIFELSEIFNTEAIVEFFIKWQFDRKANISFDISQFTDWMTEHNVDNEKAWNSDQSSAWPGLLKIMAHLIGPDIENPELEESYSMDII